MTPTKSPSTKTTSGNKGECARKQLPMSGGGGGGAREGGGGELPSRHYGGARWKFRKDQTASFSPKRYYKHRRR